MRFTWWKILCILLMFFTFTAGFLVKVPYVGNLYQSIRNFFFHVPMWFGQIILLTLSLAYSIAYLRKQNIRYDIYAAEFAKTGIIFGILGLATGSIWATYTWGEPWSNDPKQIAAAIAVLIYLAYIVLRGSMNDIDKKARVTAVYNIFAYFIYIPLIMILPRLVQSLNRAARRGLITKDSLFNDLFVQNFDQRITISGQLEPVRDLTIDVNIDKTFNKNYSETFKDTTGTGNGFAHLTPYIGGGFNVSYIALNTLFEKYDPNQVSATFLKFQDYRQILSQRLGAKNTYNKLAGNPVGADGYALGYGRYAVDVLVPAFIAAYTGQDPTKVSLVKQNNSNLKSNPFRDVLPKPNWRITYNGLSRVKGLDKIFTNFSLTHAYNATLGMNSFTSALLYRDVSRFGYPSFIDTTSGSNNYIPFFLIPNITIQEQFAPLVGIDMTFTNQLSLKFDYTKQRQLSLSLIDYQLSEVRSTEYTFGGSFRKRGLKLPFKIPFTKADTKKLDNEIKFQLDFKVRDNVTSNSRLDQNSAFATNGSKEITISPTVDYYISNRINVKLYFDQRRVNPYISSSPPTVDTRAGVQVRISLSQ